MVITPSDKGQCTCSQRKYRTRIAIPRGYQPNCDRLDDKSFQQPPSLLYGFGLHQTDLIDYYRTYISPELPPVIHAGIRNAFVKDLRKHCHTFAYFQLKKAPHPDNWHRDAYTYVLAIYTSHYLHASELREEDEKGIFDCMRNRLEGCRGQEPSWFRDPAYD
ncbi:hypothetical protein F5878DRAFT_618040 [Lentinula raphanica]|uniref:Uncharacterized protein n=1 Tax=Lentinula raphanica TaxID=153919 RepID=A0AA38PA76_9AGAR|nr:hypothetical protein F5878DRAFT_618040 [Lentinula raphanica]